MLPKEALHQALIESYLQNCFHYFSIVDSADLCNPHKSTLLHQALCLGGSLMRQTDDQSDFALSKTFNQYAVNLDGPWHWTGVAIRLAFQLGLHKEASYVNKTDAGCKRRLWWQLYASDKLHTACWGRPEAIRESDYDVGRLTLSDFENQDLEAQCIITRMELHVIVGKISQASSEGKMLSLADLTNLALLLQNWLASLPPELALHDTTGARRPYYRPAVEMHILYFVAIILVQSMASPSCASIHSRKGTPLPSFLASSCIVALSPAEDSIFERRTRELPLGKSKTNPIPPNEQPSAVDAQEAASWFLVPEWLNLHRIFAIPSHLCDEMALLDRVTVVEETGIAELDSSMRSEQWGAGELAEQEPWIHDDLNFFTDIFGMDLGGFDMAHGGSLGIVDRQLVSSNFSG
ncbi:hypothetical protein DL95DRAFT_455617 [Leptodontidium sp. 2 PMI_412]|nr:hypothetical protein DL95DRAFT_455617 [Leptodontidium sp. 2 PMI_412]